MAVHTLRFGCTIALGLLLNACAAQKQTGSSGWTSLFDGKTLNGWKVGDHDTTFKVVDGAIKVNGPVAHLFYVGDFHNHEFKNFEFKAEVKTLPGSNSGIYFHTAYQEKSWPEKGFEVQVNNSHTDWKRTGSLYNVVDVKEKYAKDNEWYTEHIIVQGRKITVKINDKVINENTEPEGEPSKLGSGTVALQGHDPKSEVHYKDVMIKVLPD